MPCLPLSLQFKLRNMEETERMKQAVLTKRMARADGTLDLTSDLGLSTAMRAMPGGSLTANYNLHRREFAMNMRGPPGSNNNPNSSSATASSSSSSSYASASGVPGGGGEITFFGASSATSASAATAATASSSAGAGFANNIGSGRDMGGRSASAPLDFGGGGGATATTGEGAGVVGATNSYGAALYGQQHAYHQAYVNRGGGRGGGRGGRVHSSDNAVFAAFKRREIGGQRNH